MVRSRLVTVAVCTLLTLGACGQNGEETDEPEEKAQAPSAVNLRTGPNDTEDPTIAVLEFLPEKVVVKTGTDVTWDYSGPEPHSVTFFPEGQTPPPPGEDESLSVGSDASGPVDGKTFINSGLRPAGPGQPQPFKVTFEEVGTFNYVCVIHPLMTGQVTVTDDEAEADSQDEITSRGDEELEKWLEEGRAAKQKLVSAPVRSVKEGNATVWSVEMGVTTPHTDVLAFNPVEAAIKAGDRVVFVNNSGAPHTASFAGGTQMPQNPESAEAKAAAPGPSPQTLSKTRFFNTGWLPPNAPPGAGPPEAARSYTYVVRESGEYEYVCLLHAGSGMVGKIKVA